MDSFPSCGCPQTGRNSCLIPSRRSPTGFSSAIQWTAAGRPGSKRAAVGACPRDRGTVRRSDPPSGRVRARSTKCFDTGGSCLMPETVPIGWCQGGQLIGIYDRHGVSGNFVRSSRTEPEARRTRVVPGTFLRS